MAVQDGRSGRLAAAAGGRRERAPAAGRLSGGGAGARRVRRAQPEEEARHRVAEERMRIARELHDVVAHHLALAHAQAGTAAHLARTHPDHVQKILTELAGTTSSALREMKGTVGLLRRADDPGAPLAPSPGLAQLAELTGAFATAGLTVTVTIEGERRRCRPGWT
ncbi:sensor histidine kinase [Streptomyces sp. L7]